MLASIYDSNGKATDIFNYVDNKIASDVSGQINAHNESETAHNDIRTGKQDKITASGLLKGDGAGGVTNAVAGTDYQTPLTTEGAQTLGIDSTPTSGSRNLITSGAVYTSLQNKADKSVAFTVTLTAAGWSDNVQTISDARFVSTGYAYTVAPASVSFADYAEAMIYADDVTADGQMMSHCDSAPTADLTVNILRMVTAE